MCYRCGENVFRNSELKRAWWFPYQCYLCPVCWEHERLSLLNPSPLPQKTFDFEQGTGNLNEPTVIYVFNSESWTSDNFNHIIGIIEEKLSVD